MNFDVEAYVRLNPKVWEAFRLYSFQALNARRTRFSARTIIERIRWDTEIAQQHGSFKIANHIAPYLARKLMAEEPVRFKGFFKTIDTPNHRELQEA